MKYPYILFYKIGMILVEGQKDSPLKIVKIPNSDLYSVNNAGNPAFKLSFIIDADFRLYKVTYVKYSFNWLLKISWLFDFVKAECIFERVHVSKAKEIRDVLELWYKDVDHHFSRSRKFINYLNSISEDGFTSQENFKTFMRIYKA